MSQRDYIPGPDEDVQAFGANYSTRITATPTAYGLVAGDATAIAALQAAFTTALTASTNPVTRTPVTVQTKDLARANLVAGLRAKSKLVQAYASITPTLLTELGLTVRVTTRTPIPPPTTRPVLSDLRSNGTVLEFTIRDELTPARRAFPNGVVLLQVFMKTGTTAPLSISDCVLADMQGNAFGAVDVATVTAGTTMHFLSRWINRRGQPGPISTVVSQIRTS